MPRSTWLISSSTSHLVSFISHLGLAGVCCVTSIYRNYCMSPSLFLVLQLLSIPYWLSTWWDRLNVIWRYARHSSSPVPILIITTTTLSHSFLNTDRPPPLHSLSSRAVALPLTPSPMQYYISGTIAFLIIEMTAQFAYYRYINKHGGGTSSLIFLFVIATLSAARNSLSFFLLLIVCMGLSVVTQDLGGVMGRVRALTAGHFVFGGKSASDSERRGDLER